MTGPQALARAQHLIALERYDAALEVLGRHLASRPDDALALCLTSQCQLRLEDLPQALSAARAALRTNPQLAWAWRLQSLVLAHGRRGEDARDSADEAIRLTPDDWRAHLTRAEIDLVTHEVDHHTQVAADQARALMPAEADAHNVCGRVALAQHRPRLAARHFRDALECDPNHAAARNNLALAQRSTYRWLAAVRNTVGALRLQPTSRLYERNLRRALLVWFELVPAAALLGCVLILATTGGRTTSVTVPGETLPPAPAVTVTVGTLPPLVVPLSGVTIPTRYHTEHTAARGRPAVLTSVAGAVIALAIFVLLGLRLAIGREAARIVRESVRRDRALAIEALAAVASVLTMAAAAVIALPGARIIAGVGIPTIGIAVLAAGANTRQRGQRGRWPLPGAGRRSG